MQNRGTQEKNIPKNPLLSKISAGRDGLYYITLDFSKHHKQADIIGCIFTIEQLGEACQVHVHVLDEFKVREVRGLLYLG